MTTPPPLPAKVTASVDQRLARIRALVADARRHAARCDYPAVTCAGPEVGTWIVTHPEQVSGLLFFAIAELAAWDER